MPTEFQALTEWKNNWTERLAMVPHWKLARLNEFSSPFMKNVWEFFDKLKSPPEPIHEYLTALPEPKGGMAKDCCAHVYKMLEYAGTHMTPKQLKKKREIEQAGLEELDRKYPDKGFRGVLKTRQEDWRKDEKAEIL
jgi:hypothetical protein